MTDTRLRPATDQLLPGEDIARVAPGDAELWVDVYTEMLAVQNQLLARLHERLRRQARLARSEVERDELAHLREQVGRFERRLAAWKARLPTAS